MFAGPLAWLAAVTTEIRDPFAGIGGLPGTAALLAAPWASRVVLPVSGRHGGGSRPGRGRGEGLRLGSPPCSRRAGVARVLVGRAPGRGGARGGAQRRWGLSVSGWRRAGVGESPGLAAAVVCVVASCPSSGGINAGRVVWCCHRWWPAGGWVWAVLGLWRRSVPAPPWGSGWPRWLPTAGMVRSMWSRWPVMRWTLPAAWGGRVGPRLFLG
jgi:hypothetical protein